VEKRDHQMICVDAGAIVSSGKDPFYERVYRIFRSMLDIMERYKPREMAIEDVFFAKNVKSSLKLGHARGAALIAAVQSGIEVFEYTPLEIKKSVVGYGRATKDQISEMVRVILSAPTLPTRWPRRSVILIGQDMKTDVFLDRPPWKHYSRYVYLRMEI
jgi:crossover junction endodeoxyribonuclease RuvC